jgi:sugar lactone lactonase YvrE
MGVMNVRRLVLTVIASLGVSLGGLALGGSALALEVHAFSNSFAGPGAGNGQLENPQGIAVNDTTHNVYVVDQGNTRIEEFTSTGVYIGQFAPPGGFGDGEGFMPALNESQIAIDDSGNPLDPSAGDVYVTDIPEKVVYKFNETGGYEGKLTAGENGAPFGIRLTGVAVSPTGVVWVSQSGFGEAQTISFSDAQVNVFQSKIPAFAGGFPGLAVDSEGRRLYIYESNKGDVTSYLRGLPVSPEGERIGEVEEIEFTGDGSISGLAADASTNIVYLAFGDHVSAFDPKKLIAESLKETFGSADLTSTSGIAVDSSTHTVYVADTATDKVVVFAATVAPDVSTGEEPTNLEHEGSATLDGVVDPDGFPVTSCEFEYGTETSPYSNTAPCVTESGGAVGGGQGPVAVHAVVSGLTPLTLYHYRLVAGNANGSDPGLDRTFLAPTHPGVSDESVFDVSADSAALSGRVDPGGVDTTYRFEYGPSASYGESVSGDAGSGTGDVEVDARLQGLAPGVVYHYRLVAENPLETVAGEDHTFVTEGSVGKSELPDGRAWEMVSPPNKHGGLLLPVGLEQGALIQSAVGGGAISYVASAPTESEPAGSRSPEVIQDLSDRGPAGWTTKVIATPHGTEHVSLALGSDSEYQLFSPDLSLGLVQPRDATPLSEEATERTPYLRHDAECETNPGGCYQPLVTSANVAPGTKFGGEFKENGALAGIHIAGASPDLSHVLLQSNVAFQANVGLTPGGTPGLYEWVAGKLAFVGDMELGHEEHIVRNAVSEDGLRVIGTGTSEGLKGLLMRDMATDKTIKLDRSESGALGGENNPVFQTASSDGSKVFFTDAAQLTTDSTAASASGSTAAARDLYEFDVETGKLSDLSVDPHPGEHAGVQIVLGASEDGSYVYFAASGALTEHAVASDCDSSEPGATCNLYVRHDGTTKLVAVLSDEDERWGDLSAEGSLELAGMRVSPNGLWLAFMSNRSLTGYDNRDAVSGKPDEEMFLYEAGAGHVICASCSPTGSRPVGALLNVSVGEGKSVPRVNESELWNNVYVAATVPGWGTAGDQKAVHQSRYLSNDGRLFFNSDDALVPQDTDGTWDVYEYEPPEVGGCSPADATFSEASGGCVGLISSGGSSGESLFMDASENGDDVFFLTSAGLVSQDYDGEYDLYDAHVCSAASPCLPVAAVSPPPCTTGDSCKAAPSPQPEIFGAPSSETFSGTGNIAAGGSSPNARSTKSLTRAQKLAAALRTCRKKAKHKRLVCERQARKRYGGKTARSVVGKSVSSRTGR